jgi:hypothetical protein
LILYFQSFLLLCLHHQIPADVDWWPSGKSIYQGGQHKELTPHEGSDSSSCFGLRNGKISYEKDKMKRPHGEDCLRVSPVPA